MKQLITFNPIFTPGASGVGTLDFSMYPNFDLGKLYAVIDLTTNIPLYIPGAPGLGITSTKSPAGGQDSAANSTILTLQANTLSCSSSDNLSIFYDTQAGVESNQAAEMGGMLQRIEESNNLILRELMVMNYILAQGMNVQQDDVTQMRADMGDIRNEHYSGTGVW